MKAQWKIPKLERTKRLNDLERLQQRVAELEEKVSVAKQETQYYKQRFIKARERLDQAIDDKTLFNALLQEEVMVPTKDGFKLLTGVELRAYCRELHERNRGRGFSTSDSGPLNFQFDLAYQQLFHANVNPRSKSQESDQEDAG